MRFCLLTLWLGVALHSLPSLATPEKPTVRPTSRPLRISLPLRVVPPLRVAPPSQNQPLPRKPEPDEAFRSVDLSQGLPTSLPFAPPKPQPRRSRPKSPYLPLPTLETQTPTELIALFQRRNWDQQRAVLDEWKRRGPSHKPILEQALEHKSPRIRLLSSIALAQWKDPSALSKLIKMAQEYDDQAGMLILGGLLAYGQQAEAPICQAFTTTTRPRLLLRALGMLQITRCADILLRYLQHHDAALHEHALNALTRLPSSMQRQIILRGLESSALSINATASLLRLLPSFPDAQTVDRLMRFRRHKNGSLRFLARILLADLAQQLHQQAPHLFPPPPRRPAYPLWRLWQIRSAKAWQQHQSTPSTALSTIPPTYPPQKSWILYRLIHPVFGVGWMPLLIHDARWDAKQPPISGKIWKIALPPQEFAALLRSLQHKGFFQLYPNTGYRREITVSIDGKQHTVRAGDARYIAFEEIEASMRALARRARVGLIFRDLFERRDEADITDDGIIGLWAWRTSDRLPSARWNALEAWRGKADLESVFSALRAMFRYMPSRTRLASVDIQNEKVRATTLLFGTRELSRLTLNGFERAQRLRNVKVNGISVSYLSTDKIEQAIFDMRRLLIPLGTNASRRFDSNFPLLSILHTALTHPTISIHHLSWQTPRRKIPLCGIKHSPNPRRFCRFFSLHRLSLHLKLRDPRALLRVLSKLAEHSRADRVLALRLNPSGFPDRNRFSLILQAHIEMIEPLPPPTAPHPFLRFSEEIPFHPFLPIHP